MIRCLSASIAICMAACGSPTQQDTTTQTPAGGTGWTIKANKDLNTLFDCLEAEGLSLVSAHRGGPYSGYPENALETMSAILQQIPAVIEIDVAASSDGVHYLMHDSTLDRTTNGEGEVDALTWEELSGLRLEDENGRITDFAPPRFDEVLAWAKDRTILQIDFKRSADYETVTDEIRRQNAEDQVVLIAYSLGSARKLHRLLPNAMISLSLESQSELNRAVAEGVPANRLMGFTGTEAPRVRLFDLLTDRDVEIIFGTLGGRNSIDNEIARSGSEDRYAAIAAQGVDIITTDRPLEAHAALAAAGRAADEGVCGVSRH